MKMYKTIILIIIHILLPAHGYCNIDDGKHPMIGNSIFPLTDVNIKLSGIKVTMERKKIAEDTKVTTEYVLENIDSEEVTFKTAFPVESNCLSCTKMPNDFKVFVDSKPIQTSVAKIVRRDILLRLSKEISLKSEKIEDMKNEIPLIVWNLSFKPKEKLLVKCTYTMEWGGDPGEGYLEYNLIVLDLWKGSIDEALFRLILPPELIKEIKTTKSWEWPKIEIHPQEYSIKNNTIEWFYRDLKQKEFDYIGVSFNYRKPGVIGD